MTELKTVHPLLRWDYLDKDQICVLLHACEEAELAWKVQVSAKVKVVAILERIIKDGFCTEDNKILKRKIEMPQVFLLL